MKVTVQFVTEWLVTHLLHYRQFCYIIGKFWSYIKGAYYVTLIYELVVTLSANLELIIG